VAQATPPPRVIISEATPPEMPGELSAGLAADQQAYNKQTTAQLLEGTEANLKSIQRTLTATEQEMVAHIRNYMAEARAATADGDAVRAHNLALKARLLSNELVAR